MVSFDLTEPTFDKKKSSEYELSVLLGADSLSYCIIDKADNVLSVVKNDYPEENGDTPLTYAAKLERLIHSDIALQQTYKQSYVGVFNEISTLVPNRLYTPDENKTYLERMLPLKPEHSIRKEELSNISAQHLYALPTELLETCQTYFSGSKIIHSATGLYHGYRKAGENQSGQKVYVNVLSEALQIYFFEENDLIFYNVFPYSSSKDFIYFVMLIFDRFSLKPDTVPVFISGEIMEDSEIYHLIYRYVQNLSFLNTPTGLNFTERWNNRPQHWFFDLFSLRLC